jgi:hypothetical protein
MNRRDRSTECVDCGVETLPADERRAEWYMVTDHVWAATGMDEFDGCLCIGCLEARIGRPLTATDFTDCPVNDLSDKYRHKAFSWRTPRLVARLSGQLPLPFDEATA